jgi:hypothetical protein
VPQLNSFLSTVGGHPHLRYLFRKLWWPSRNFSLAERLDRSEETSNPDEDVSLNAATLSQFVPHVPLLIRRKKLLYYQIHQLGSNHRGGSGWDGDHSWRAARRPPPTILDVGESLSEHPYLVVSMPISLNNEVRNAQLLKRGQPERQLIDVLLERLNARSWVESYLPCQFQGRRTQIHSVLLKCRPQATHVPVSRSCDFKGLGVTSGERQIKIMQAEMGFDIPVYRNNSELFRNEISRYFLVLPGVNHPRRVSKPRYCRPRRGRDYLLPFARL